MKKELKINEEFKIFNNSTFVIKHSSNIRIYRNGDKELSLFLIETISPEFKPNKSLDEKIELINEYFKNTTYEGCLINSVESVEIKPYNEGIISLGDVANNYTLFKNVTIDCSIF